MHMADALLAPAVAATMYAASAVTVGASVKTLRKDEATAKLPTMAVTSALVFAGQMINYTIPGTGSSGHLCGGMLLSALLGPQAGFLSMVVILTMNREIRRRARVVGAFPDGNSALMLVCARLRHVAGTQWGCKKYMNMKHLETMEQEPQVG